MLEVTLTPGGNAVVHATVKNVGVEPLNLLSYGTLFDPAPVQKVYVYEGGEFSIFLFIQECNRRMDLFYLQKPFHMSNLCVTQI